MSFQLERCHALLGQKLHSEPRLISQEMIDRFATASDDHQYIHTNPEAAAKSPFGGTVAHGFLMLSLLPSLLEEVMPPLPRQIMLVNAGFDRVRFVAPCPAGARMRASFTLREVDEPREAELALKWEVSLEPPERPDAPFAVALWLNRIFLEI